MREDHERISNALEALWAWALEPNDVDERVGRMAKFTGRMMAWLVMSDLADHTVDRIQEAARELQRA